MRHPSRGRRPIHGGATAARCLVEFSSLTAQTRGERGGLGDGGSVHAGVLRLAVWTDHFGAVLTWSVIFGDGIAIGTYVWCSTRGAMDRRCVLRPRFRICLFIYLLLVP